MDLSLDWCAIHWNKQQKTFNRWHLTDSVLGVRLLSLEIFGPSITLRSIYTRFFSAKFRPFLFSKLRKCQNTTIWLHAPTTVKTSCFSEMTKRHDNRLSAKVYHMNVHYYALLNKLFSHFSNQSNDLIRPFKCPSHFRIRIRIVYWWNAETTITHQDLWLGN